MAMEDEIKQLRGTVEELNATLVVSLNNLATVVTALAERMATPAAGEAVTVAPKAKPKAKAKSKEKADKPVEKVTNIEDAKPPARDIEEARTEARVLLTVLIGANKRDVAQSLIRRVAPNHKLPDIESVDTLDKLANLCREYIAEHDLEAG
jgi:hypothetical protein